MKRDLKTVRDLLGACNESLIKIKDAAEKENRSRTEDEVKQWNTLIEERRGLEDELKYLVDADTIARAAATFPAGGDISGNKASSDGEQRDLAKFDLGKAIRQLYQGERLDGVEGEVIAEGRSEAIRKGVSPTGNLVLPYEKFAINKEGRDLIKERLERRDLSATGMTSVAGDQGGNTISTTVGQLLEALFNKLQLLTMGANFMPNMVGNYTVPRVIKGNDPTWKTENATADEINPTTANVVLSPNRLPAYIEVSNQLFLQSTANIGDVVKRYLVSALSEIFEKATINGAGKGSNMPLGILNTPGINALYAGAAPAAGTNANGAALIWDDIVALYSALSTSNTDKGKLGYLLNPKTVGKLQTTLVAGNTAAQFIMPQGAQSLNAFQVGITGNVPSTLSKGASGNTLSAMIFGNFEDLTICTWGGIDLMVNPYSRDTEGITRINASMYGDSAVTRPESFAAIKDIKTTA